MRPLDRVGSIKLKLSLVIVAAVAITALVSVVGLRTGIPVWLRPIISVAIALVLVYPFARGVASPLREMAAASRAMAQGDYSRPVSTTSRDEVGELALAFDAMRAELADVDRQRRELIANVAHELRTPLAALRARFENIADGVEAADSANVAATLMEIERLSHLLDQLLDLSRIESGAVALEVAEFDYTAMLQSVADEAARHEPDAILVVSTEGAVLGSGDELKLRQVLSNLVRNAVRYSPTCEPVVLTVSSTGRDVILRVSDRGPGIPVQERQRVLQRFYRSDHGRASDSGGAGLGLAIASSIVELHGGAIEIGSNEPTGCLVTVSIPQKRRSSNG